MISDCDDLERDDGEEEAEGPGGAGPEPGEERAQAAGGVPRVLAAVSLPVIIIIILIIIIIIIIIIILIIIIIIIIIIGYLDICEIKM